MESARPKTISLRCVAAPSGTVVSRNHVHVHPSHVAGSPTYLEINGVVFVAVADEAIPVDAVALNMQQRKTAKASKDEVITCAYFVPPAAGFALSCLSIDVELHTPSKNAVELDAEAAAKFMAQQYVDHVFTFGQTFFLEFRDKLYVCTCASLEQLPRELSGDVIGEAAGKVAEKVAGKAAAGKEPLLVQRGLFVRGTEIVVGKAGTKNAECIKLTNAKSKGNAIFRPSFDFAEMGIGGLDEEFRTIFRRAFASRVFPSSVVRKLGLNHVKGILLHGPPGTGKTLMARQIGKMLNAAEIKVVNGPEVLNKYVGQSEENVRNLFAAAEKDQREKGDDSGLHLIIFDELDAICKQRGSSRDGTGVGDSVVNQLLSKIDGVDSLNNVLLIGMTNRKDMIDEALLRPGRLEVQIEVSLPDEQGRRQILGIHTKSIKEAGCLDGSVDLASIAERAKNFSGAELEGLVKAAASFAFNRKVEPEKIGKAPLPDDLDDVRITQDDFDRALAEVKPAFGIDAEEVDSRLRGEVHNWGPEFERIVETCRGFVKQFETSARSNLLTVLLEGPPGTGKTTLAVRVARDAEFPLLRVVAPDAMVGSSDAERARAIAKAFEDAYKSDLSVLVLDNLERLLEYAHIGPRFSNAVLQTLLVLLKKNPPQGRKLLVLATTSCASVLDGMELLGSFSAAVHVPEISSREAMVRVLERTGAFSPEELKREAAHLPSSIGIKKLLVAAELARDGLSLSEVIDSFPSAAAPFPTREF